MAIGSREIKRHLGDMDQVSGSAVRKKLAGSIKNTDIGKKHNLHRTRGVDPKALDRRLKDALKEMGVGDRDIKKIYDSKSSSIKGGGKIVEDVFKEMSKGATKGYEKKKILESMDTFAQTDSESEFKSERQSKSGGWSGLFRRKNKQERGGGKFANMKEEQMEITNSGQPKADDGEEKKKLSTTQHLHAVQTKLTDEDEDKNHKVYPPLPTVRRN